MLSSIVSPSVVYSVSTSTGAVSVSPNYTGDFGVVSSQNTQEKTKSKRESEAEKTAQEIEDFFKKMKEAGGTMKYMVQSNMEKIKKILDEKEKELKEKLGLNSQPPLEGEALKSATDTLQNAMKDFTKQLMGELNDRFKQEKKTQSVQMQAVQSPLAKLLAV